MISEGVAKNHIVIGGIFASDASSRGGSVVRARPAPPLLLLLLLLLLRVDTVTGSRW